MAADPAAAGAPQFVLPPGATEDDVAWRWHTWELNKYGVNKFLGIRNMSSAAGSPPRYVATSFKPDLVNRLRTELRAFGVDDILAVDNNRLSVIALVNGNATDIGTSIGAVVESDGNSGYIQLYTVKSRARQNRFDGDQLLTLIANVKNVLTEILSEQEKKAASLAAATLAKSKLNIGTEGTTGLTNKITDFLGTPRVPARLMGPGGRRRKTRKHRSRKHKKTRKH